MASAQARVCDRCSGQTGQLHTSNAHQTGTRQAYHLGSHPQAQSHSTMQCYLPCMLVLAVYCNAFRDGCAHGRNCVQYPSGRWGNAKSPAYGTLNDYQFMRRHTSNEQRLGKAKAAWGADLTSVDDVVKVFVKYTSGEFCRCTSGLGCSWAPASVLLTSDMCCACRQD